MSENNYISVTNLKKYFNEIKAVDGLDLTVNKGDIYGFLGPNGAGKSTTIRMILSLIKPDAGSIEVFGYPLRQKRSDILKNVGALIEKPDFYPYLSAYKNLQLLSQYSGKDVSSNRIFEILDLVGLKDRHKSKVKTFSQGMKQRLGIAQTLLHDPDILILDEPGNGLDPQGTKDVRELIVYLNREKGKTIFLSSHLLPEIELIANRMVIINKGKAVAEGLVKDLLNADDLSVLFKIGDSSKAYEIVQKSGYANKLVEKTSDELKFCISKNEIHELNKLFIQNNIEIESIKPLRNLEEYFLKITKENV